MDFDNANARAEEEAENANQLRNLLNKAQADLQALKSKYVCGFNVICVCVRLETESKDM